MGWGFYQNLNFSFLGQIFQYYLLGFKVCRLRFASFGIRAQLLKSVLLSLYLLFPVIILSCSFCVFYSLFLFCDMNQVKIVHQGPKKKKKKKKWKKKVEMSEKKRKEKRKKKNLFVVLVLSNQNIVFFYPFPLIHCFFNIFLSSILV